jgi:hypothetical protein
MTSVLKHKVQRHEYAPKTEAAVFAIRYKQLQMCNLFSRTSRSAVSVQKQYL